MYKLNPEHYMYMCKYRSSYGESILRVVDEVAD